MARAAPTLDADLDGGWRHLGACNHADPDLFTSSYEADQGQARWICLHRCQVRGECLAWAQANPRLADQAVYGGQYWTRRRRTDGGRSGDTPRPSPRQPVPVPPGQPVRHRPEAQHRGGTP